MIKLDCLNNQTINMSQALTFHPPTAAIVTPYNNHNPPPQNDQNTTNNSPTRPQRRKHQKQQTTLDPTDSRTQTTSKHNNNNDFSPFQHKNHFKKFSPEWYSYLLAKSLLIDTKHHNNKLKSKSKHKHKRHHKYGKPRSLQSIFSDYSTNIVYTIFSIIGEYSRGIRCLYLCQSGYQLSNLCEIGNTHSDLYLTDNSFTIECWCHLKYASNQLPAHFQTSRQGDQTIVGGRSLADQQALHITIRHMCPHFGFSMKNSKYNLTALDCMLQANIWYHLAFVYDIEYKQMKIYVNSKLQATKNRVEPLKGDRDLCISHFFQGRPLFGYLTELRIWNVARNENDIKSLMWKFDINENEINENINVIENDNDNDNENETEMERKEFNNEMEEKCAGNNENRRRKVILRKYFTMTEDMQWVQKIKNENECKFDHLIGYC